MSLNNKKKRRGPSPKPVEDQRSHRISIFLTENEYRKVQHKAGAHKLPEYVRASALGNALAPKPATIPTVNLETWKKLSRTTNNLNQLVRLLHIHGHPDVALDVTDLNRLLAEFRNTLIGGDL